MWSIWTRCCRCVQTSPRTWCRAICIHSYTVSLPDSTSALSLTGISDDTYYVTTWEKPMSVLCLIHTAVRQDKTVLSCFVGGVNLIGDKSRLFSVVFTASQDWVKEFRNFLSRTVLTCRQFCSHRRRGQNKTVLSCPCRWSGLGIKKPRYLHDEKSGLKSLCFALTRL